MASFATCVFVVLLGMLWLAGHPVERHTIALAPPVVIRHEASLQVDVPVALPESETSPPEPPAEEAPGPTPELGTIDGEQEPDTEPVDRENKEAPALPDLPSPPAETLPEPPTLPKEALDIDLIDEEAHDTVSEDTSPPGPEVAETRDPLIEPDRQLKEPASTVSFSARKGEVRVSLVASLKMIDAFTSEPICTVTNSKGLKKMFWHNTHGVVGWLDLAAAPKQLRDEGFSTAYMLPVRTTDKMKRALASRLMEDRAALDVHCRRYLLRAVSSPIHTRILSAPSGAHLKAQVLRSGRGWKVVVTAEPTTPNAKQHRRVTP